MKRLLLLMAIVLPSLLLFTTCERVEEIDLRGCWRVSRYVENSSVWQDGAYRNIYLYFDKGYIYSWSYKSSLCRTEYALKGRRIVDKAGNSYRIEMDEEELVFKLKKGHEHTIFHKDINEVAYKRVAMPDDMKQKLEKQDVIDEKELNIVPSGLITW